MNYNKVFFICDYCADYGGNFLASFNFLATKLSLRGVKVYFIFPEKAKEKKWEIDFSNSNILYCKFNDKELIDTINNHLTKGDHVIVHLNFISSLFLLKLRKLCITNIKFIFHQHMAINFGLKQIVKGIILRLYAPKRIAYIGVSPEVYKDVEKEVGKEKSYLVLNAIDTDRLKLSNSINTSNILIFGTDYERKGVDIAIEAIRNSNISHKCKLLIVTHNVMDVRKLILAQFGAIPKFVEILPPVQNVEKLYRKSFLFLSPSRLEAFGYAVVEAAYSGSQVIISDIPGQNILSRIPGIKTVQPENINQLKLKIEKAYVNKYNDRKKTNKEAREYIDNHFSLEYWANRVLKIYDSL